MRITRVSEATGRSHTMELPVTPEQLLVYEEGALVQIAFPHLTPAQREFVKTGITEEEWAAIFPPETDEEDER